jgi:hypothetical protein
VDLIDRSVVTGVEADALWELYRASFDPLRTLAAQRHLMHRYEFDEVMGDPRIHKLVVRDSAVEGSPVALATITNDLTAVPLVSPDYFEARWPDHYAPRRIWYIIFLGVEPDHQGAGATPLLIGGAHSLLPPDGGIIAMDMCDFNEKELNLPAVFLRVARTFVPGST